MKRLFYALAFLSSFILTGTSFGATAITLDDVTNLIGGDTVEAGKTIRFTIRFTYTPGTGMAINSFSNGFQVYTAKSDADPLTAGYFDPAVIDTFSITPTWETMFDMGVFLGPVPSASDGKGRDTVSIGGLLIAGTGMEDGFDQPVLWIETGNLQNGDTVCLDSCWFHPSNPWLWSGPNPSDTIKPDWAGPYCFHVFDPTSDVKTVEGPNLPTTFALSQNYPNPFNPSTQIKFDIPVRSHVRLTIYNVLGQRVKTLVDREMAPNFYIVDWDGTSDNGTHISSGVYFYKLEAEGFVETKKMVLLK